KHACGRSSRVSGRFRACAVLETALGAVGARCRDWSAGADSQPAKVASRSLKRSSRDGDFNLISGVRLIWFEAWSWPCIRPRLIFGEANPDDFRRRWMFSLPVTIIQRNGIGQLSIPVYDFATSR